MDHPQRGTLLFAALVCPTGGFASLCVLWVEAQPTRIRVVPTRPPTAANNNGVPSSPLAPLLLLCSASLACRRTVADVLAR